MAKKKERFSRGLFVVEGEKQVFEAPPDRVEGIFCTESFAAAHPKALIPVITETVSDRVFAKMSDTDTPQGILAVIKMQETCPDKIYAGSGRSGEESDDKDHPQKNRYENLILFLEDIRDPGNLGTIIRSAEAAGVTGIIMSRDTVDVYNPKTVRSTMGSVYRVPFLYTDDLYAELKKAKKNGIKLYAAYLQSSIPYYEADLTMACGILIGNEAKGLTQQAAELADERIIIPMSGSVESLNAAIAASVVSFEAKRQREN